MGRGTVLVQGKGTGRDIVQKPSTLMAQQLCVRVHTAHRRLTATLLPSEVVKWYLPLTVVCNLFVHPPLRSTSPRIGVPELQRSRIFNKHREIIFPSDRILHPSARRCCRRRRDCQTRSMGRPRCTRGRRSLPLPNSLCCGHKHTPHRLLQQLGRG